MSENPRRGRQERNFTTNVPKILDLKSPSEQIFFLKLSLGAPGLCCNKGGESALSPRGSGAYRGDIPYCQKV